MSTENESSAPVVTPTTQGGNPVPKLEARGERDFEKQISDQGGAQKAAAETQTEAPTHAAQAETTQTALAKTAATAATPSTAAPNADTIKSIVEATVAGMSKQTSAQQPPQERELTAAEFNQKYGIPTVDAAFMSRILDADPAKGAVALQSLIIQAVRSGALISKDLYTADLNKFRSEAEPHFKYITAEQTRQREASLQKEFYELYPTLKGEEALVEELTSSVKARVDAGQLKISSKEEAFKLVADAANKIVARLQKPVAGGNQQGGQGGNTQTSTRQMSAASSAGRSGTGQPTTKTAVEEVFGNDAR